MGKCYSFFLIFLSGIGYGQNQNADSTCLMAARIPDVITPNGDTKNDFFHFDLPCTPDKFLITIYNPQREIIFTSDNQQFKWDGKDLKRQDAQLNKYMYIIVITNKDGKENSLTGELIVYL